MTYPKPDPSKRTPSNPGGASIGLAYGGHAPVPFAPAIALDLCSDECVIAMVAHLRKFGTHDRVQVESGRVAGGGLSHLHNTEMRLGDGSTVTLRDRTRERVDLPPTTAYPED